MKRPAERADKRNTMGWAYPWVDLHPHVGFGPELKNSCVWTLKQMKMY